MIPEIKKILLFTDWFYPGYKAGGPIQSCRNFIAAMEPEFDIWLITSDRDFGDEMPYEGIIANEWVPYGRKTKVYYTKTGALNVNMLQNLIEEVMPDFIYMNSMFSYRFTILPLLLKWRNKIPATMVIAPRGMLHEGAFQFKKLKKQIFVMLLNLSGLPQRIHFHATDEQEKNDIAHFFSRAGSVTIAPNFPRMPANDWKVTEKTEGKLRCVFVSRIAPKKNLLHFLTLLSKVPAPVEIDLVIRGEIEDKIYWKSCDQAIAALPSNISVQFEGPIPNDEVLLLIERHHLFVLPTFGENFGHAIFEAFAAGRPVLISDRTPWRNLEKVRAGWDIPLDDDKSFVDVLVRTARMSQEEFNDWCKGAWQFAKDFFRMNDIEEPYKKLFS